MSFNQKGNVKRLESMSPEKINTEGKEKSKMGDFFGLGLPHFFYFPTRPCISPAFQAQYKRRFLVCSFAHFSICLWLAHREKNCGERGGERRSGEEREADKQVRRHEISLFFS
jgi:hypothetical protein